ncbi:hypothetical protein ACFL43_05235 [Thermodesulfobacteriota bacterium]
MMCYRTGRLACIGVLLMAVAFFAVPPAGTCGEPGSVMVLEAEVVGGEAGPEKITESQVEAAQQLSSARIYGLAGLWLLVALCILLISFQWKDDEHLYTVGYYRKDLDH